MCPWSLFPPGGSTGSDLSWSWNLIPRLGLTENQGAERLLTHGAPLRITDAGVTANLYVGVTELSHMRSREHSLSTLIFTTH